MLTGDVPPTPSAFRTLGIDLASQAKETGVCAIDWSRSPASVVELEKLDLHDDHLLALMCDPAVGKVGIDAPFGWPAAFIDAVTSFRDTGTWLDLDTNELRFRSTEMRVWDEIGQQPLSVAMSDLSWPAIRCARLLSRLAQGDGPLDRTGRGRVAEVYPMAALRRWGVIESGTPSTEWSYKGTKSGRRERREQHMTRLTELLKGTVAMSSDFVETCAADDDDFDAFVSALVARAVVVGKTDPVPRGHAWLAMREGWIQLPAAGSAGQLAA